MSTTEPDEQEILQEEPQSTQPIKPVPVAVDGPVRVQALPAVIASMRSFTVGTTAETVLGSDPRRKRAVIIAVDSPIYLGENQGDTNGGYGFMLPDRVPLEITHTGIVWAALAAASGTSVVSVMIEEWTN